MTAETLVVCLPLPVAFLSYAFGLSFPLVFCPTTCRDVGTASDCYDSWPGRRGEAESNRGDEEEGARRGTEAARTAAVTAVAAAANVARRGYQRGKGRAKSRNSCVLRGCISALSSEAFLSPRTTLGGKITLEGFFSPEQVMMLGLGPTRIMPRSRCSTHQASHMTIGQWVAPCSGEKNSYLVNIDLPRVAFATGPSGNQEPSAFYQTGNFT